MKKRLLTFLAALPALAVALPPAGGFSNPYAEKMRALAEVANPVAKSPDNLVRRYVFFRAPMFKDMMEYADDVLMFGWGEPIFFIPEKFFGVGFGEWEGDYDGFREYAEVVDPELAPEVVWWRVWVGERVSDDGESKRQWVIFPRGAKYEMDEDILYAVDADADYAPFTTLNFVFEKWGMVPSRNNDGTPRTCGESWFMGFMYDIFDPARYRMAVNLMDYRDYLKLQHAKGKTTSKDHDDEWDGGDGPVIIPPEPEPNPFATLSTNLVLQWTSGVTNDLYLITYTNTTAKAIQTRFAVTNQSEFALDVEWRTNNVLVGKYALPEHKAVSTNFVIAAATPGKNVGAHIWVGLSSFVVPPVTNATFGIVWESAP